MADHELLTPAEVAVMFRVNPKTATTLANTPSAATATSGNGPAPPAAVTSSPSKSRTYSRPTSAASSARSGDRPPPAPAITLLR